jgi:hypothetical protein
MVVGTSTCQACQTLDRTVFRQASWVEAILDGYVAARVDAAERPDVARAARRHARARGGNGRLPLVLVARPNGEVLEVLESPPHQVHTPPWGRALQTLSMNARSSVTTAPLPGPLPQQRDQTRLTPLRALAEQYDPVTQGLVGWPHGFPPRLLSLAVLASRDEADAALLDRAVGMVEARCRGAGKTGGASTWMGHFLEVLLDAYAARPRATLHRCATRWAGHLRDRRVVRPAGPGARGLAAALVTESDTQPPSHPAPRGDDTAYAATNATVARALLGLSATLGLAWPRLLALEVLETWLGDGYRPGGGFAHGLDPRAGAMGTGTLADQAAMTRALVEAYQHTGSQAYLRAATETAMTAAAWFPDTPGSWRSSLPAPAEAPFLGDTAAWSGDDDVPSPQAEMALALLDVADVTGEAAPRALAAQMAAAGGAAGGVEAATWELVTRRLARPAWEVRLSGRLAERGVVAMTDAVLGARRLGVVLRHGPPTPTFPPHARPQDLLPVASLCSWDRGCWFQTRDPDHLHALLVAHPGAIP